MSVVVSFMQAMLDCELRIGNAQESEPAIARALAYGCGMAHGYYLAGDISKYEYATGCEQLRRAANQRIDMHRMRMGEAA